MTYTQQDAVTRCFFVGLISLLSVVVELKVQRLKIRLSLTPGFSPVIHERD